MIDRMKAAVSALAPELVELRRTLHQNPELSMQEHETSQRILEMLTAHGIEAQYISEQLGVTALIQGGKQGDTIALRADIDALPVQEQTGLPYASGKEGVMHACGHDLHTAVLVGAAIVLNRLRAELCGTVRLIFQCSEEKLAGAQMALDAGVLDTPPVSSIAALHCWPDLPAGTIGIRRGAMMASSDTLKITVSGRGGHAAHPHRSIDPIVGMAYVLTALQTLVSREVAPVDSAVLTVGKIEGGTAGNIIPSTVECQGTVRTLTPAVRDSMPERIERIASHTAQAHGCQCAVEYRKVCPPLVNDDRLVSLLEQSLADSVGAENIRYLDTPSMGSEDFAFYLERVPGMLFRLGTHNEQPESRNALHNANVVFDDSAIETGVAAMCGYAISLLHVEEESH